MTEQPPSTTGLQGALDRALWGQRECARLGYVSEARGWARIEAETRAKMAEATKPTIPEVRDRFAAYHEAPGNGVWGSLHIVLEEGNVRDCHIAASIDWAEERGDREGVELLRILLRMSTTQRKKLAYV